MGQEVSDDLVDKIRTIGSDPLQALAEWALEDGDLPLRHADRIEVHNWLMRLADDVDHSDDAADE